MGKIFVDTISLISVLFNESVPEVSLTYFNISLSPVLWRYSFLIGVLYQQNLFLSFLYSEKFLQKN